MTRRTYGQYCGLARALDLVGERWTLLLVRDVAIRPRRFTELLAGLPGMGTSLLSERLRHLEHSGVLKRAVAARPAAGVVYELTDEGRALASAMLPLARWGAALLGPRTDEELNPDWLAYAITSLFRPDAAQGVRDCYELRVEGITLWVTVEDGTIAVAEERPRDPDFVVIADMATLAELSSGTLSPEDAAAQGRARLEGNPDAGARMLLVFGVVTPSAKDGASRSPSAAGGSPSAKANRSSRRRPR